MNPHFRLTPKCSTIFIARIVLLKLFICTSLTDYVFTDYVHRGHSLSTEFASQMLFYFAFFYALYVDSCSYSCLIHVRCSVPQRLNRWRWLFTNQTSQHFAAINPCTVSDGAIVKILKIVILIIVIQVITIITVPIAHTSRAYHFKQVCSILFTLHVLCAYYV